jgi:hypothetical protein
MENLSKEILLTIINDLNDKLNELKIENIKLEEKVDSVQQLNCELVDKNRSLHDEILTIKSEQDSDSNDESVETETEGSFQQNKSDKDKWGFTPEQKKNMVIFLSNFCEWTCHSKMIHWREDCSTYRVAHSSTAEIYKAMNHWAKGQNIPTSGKEKGIPSEYGLKKYLVHHHKKQFPDQPWRVSETNQFPKFYNGSVNTPRINLKLKYVY